LWEHAGRFGAIAWYQGAPLLQFRGQGFKQLVQGEWQLLQGTESLSTQVHTVLPLPDDSLLLIGVAPEWRTFSDKGVGPYAMPPGFPPAEGIVSGTSAADGTLILTTQHGEVYLYDPVRGRYRSVKVDNGYLNDATIGEGGNVLTAGDSGFYAIPWPSEWTIIDASRGIKGSVARIVEHDGDWYTLGSSGIFRSAGGSADFAALDWTSNEAWDLLFLEDGSALLAESYSLVRVDSKGARPISDDQLYPRLLRQSRFDPDIVYAGTENGVAVLQRRGDSWQIVHEASLDSVNVISLAETAANEVWISSSRDGIRRLVFTRQEGAEGRWQSEVMRFGAGDGIHYGSEGESWLTLDPDGELLVSSRAGVFKQDAGRFVAVDLGGLGPLRGEDELLRLAWSKDGDAWAYSDYRVFARSGTGWIEKDTSGVLDGAIQDHAFDGRRVVFGTTGAVMILDTHGDQAAIPTPPLTMTGAEFESRDGTREALSLVGAPASGQRHGWLRVRFTLPDLNQPHAVRYQTRLLPVESGFTNWNESSQVSYFDLAPGDYQLLARARDSRGNETERRLFQFAVPAAWYQTTHARAGFAVLALLIFLAAAHALSRHRSRALATANERLRLMVAERTRELESANRRLDSLAHFDSLTDIPNRRRLEAFLKEVWQQCAVQGRKLAVAIVDVDHFKQYNDSHGHLEGDNLLKALAGVLSRSLRRSEDLVARYGGEEFLLVFPGADHEVAMDVSEAVRAKIAESDMQITISVGVAVSAPQPGGDVRALLESADKALYAAKNAGRNRVVLAQAS